MHYETDYLNVLAARSFNTSSISNETEGLSAWSTDPNLEIINRKIFSAASTSVRPSPKYTPRYTKTIQPRVVRDRPMEIKEEKRFNLFSRNTPTFAAYLNTLISKNSQVIRKNEKNLGKRGKLEIISVKLHTFSPKKRFQSLSPDRLNKMKLPRGLEETFLIHQRIPPSISGFSMTVYPKHQRTQSKTSEFRRNDKKIMKKHSSQKLVKKADEKVENIYGVHFDYEDLCSRLLKVQKAQRRSETKSPKTRVFSAESVKLKRDDSAKKHKVEVTKANTDISLNPGKVKDIKTNTDTSLNPGKLKEIKSPTNKKMKIKSKSIKKTENNKVLSPRDVRKKTSNAVTAKKKIDKTLNSTSKLIKKISTSLLRKEKP